ncbi:MAG: DNA-directed RNA polymerase subunit alpha C-terminal domain-containing protein [Candidatus Saccharibacteria bacterium]
MTVTMETPIEELGLATVTGDCLKRDGVYSVEKLLERPDSRRRDIPGFNQESRDEVVKLVKALAEAGLPVR